MTEANQNQQQPRPGATAAVKGAPRGLGICQFSDFLFVLLIHGRLDAYRSLRKCQILAFFKHSKDQFACHGCPGAVLNDCHLTILVITLGQTFDKTAHSGEEVSIISNTRQHQSVITESIGNSFCFIASCQVIQYCFLSFFL